MLSLVQGEQSIQRVPISRPYAVIILYLAKDVVKNVCWYETGGFGIAETVG